MFVKNVSGYVNRDKPLVMVWNGKDNLLRGDCKGNIGLGLHCADILGGHFIDLDREKLKALFPKTRSYVEQIKMALRIYGEPDILIGVESFDVTDHMKHKPILQYYDINEHLARRYGRENYVAHNLTEDLLKAEGEEFCKRYPDIKGPLVAIMLGGNASFFDLKRTAKQLSQMVERCDDVNFFICPSIRTNGADETLIKLLSKDHKSIFNFFAVPSYIKSLYADKRNVNILHWPYKKEAALSYNPYYGLLDQADHICVLGDSFSLVSEALFTDKPIYADFMGFHYQDEVKKGRIIPMDKASPLVFIDKKFQSINPTRDIAKKIADSYLLKRAEGSFRVSPS